MERRRLGAPDAPHIVIDTGGGQTAVFQNGAWNRAVAGVAVFDDQFIDENVYSGLAVGSDHRQNLHELILGAHGVALSGATQNAITAADAAPYPSPGDGCDHARDPGDSSALKPSAPFRTAMTSMRQLPKAKSN